jgi:hypothetical protein
MHGSHAVQGVVPVIGGETAPRRIISLPPREDGSSMPKAVVCPRCVGVLTVFVVFMGDRGVE